MKQHSGLFIFCSFLGVVLSGCLGQLLNQLDPPTNNLPSPVGSYETTTFIVPAANDGLYDVLQAGGYIRLRLYPNGHFAGRIFQPPDTRFLPEGEQSTFVAQSDTLIGTYELAHDTLRFESHLLPFREAQWIPSENLIRTFAVPMRGPFEIVLEARSTPDQK